MTQVTKGARKRRSKSVCFCLLLPLIDVHVCPAEMEQCGSMTFNPTQSNNCRSQKLLEGYTEIYGVLEKSLETGKIKYKYFVM